MKKVAILLLLISLGLVLSGCLLKKNTNQNINTKEKAKKNLDYFCNLPKVPADYIKDCENFQKGFESGLIE